MYNFLIEQYSNLTKQNAILIEEINRVNKKLNELLPNVTSTCDVEGYVLCDSYRCTLNNENPNCADQQNWGCALCNDGYFRENFDIPCLDCSNIIGCNITDGCTDFTGCNSCLFGYERIWNEECQFFICNLS